MKEFTLILASIVFSLALTGQETKLIIRKFDGSNQVAEKYSVLKSDGKTKHGEYFLYFQVPEQQYKVKKNDKSLEIYIKLKVTYQEGKKHGDWEEYDRPFSFKTKGKYENDKKIGIWQTAKEQGQVIENFNYDTGQKLLPIFKVSVGYPDKAQEELVQGTVIVNYKTSKECDIYDIVITKSLSKDCDSAVIQWVNRLFELRKKYGDICEEKNETKEIKFL